MKRYIILLVFLLFACASQNSDHKIINNDNSLKPISGKGQENHIEDEVPTLKPDSVNKELGTKKTSTHEADKSIEKKDVVTYGSVRYENTTISFKTLPSVSDSSKEQGTSGYISKGSNGLNRKEVRDVYINGKYSHIETVKETYLVSKPIDEQKWIGTKETVQDDDDDSWESLGYHFYKKYDSFETCNIQADELARINSKNGWLSTLCDGPNLYYTLRD